MDASVSRQLPIFYTPHTQSNIDPAAQPLVRGVFELGIGIVSLGTSVVAAKDARVSIFSHLTPLACKHRGILRSSESGKTRYAFIGRWRGEEVEFPSGRECGDAGMCGEKPEDVGESLPAWHVL